MKNFIRIIGIIAILALAFISCDTGNGPDNGNNGAKEYWTVTWNLNGGSWTGSTPSTSIEKGTALSKPADPARSFNGFVNWYTNDTLTAEYNFSNIVTANLVLYAKWQGVPTIWHGTYYPEFSMVTETSYNSNGGQAVFNISHLSRLLNGEVTTSKLWPEYGGLIHDGLSGDGIGRLNKNFEKYAVKETTAITWNNALGWLVIITPTDFGQVSIEIGGIPTMWTTHSNILIYSISYNVHVVNAVLDAAFSGTWEIKF